MKHGVVNGIYDFESDTDEIEAGKYYEPTRHLIMPDRNKVNFTGEKRNL
jgi:hypothetical protein